MTKNVAVQVGSFFILAFIFSFSMNHLPQIYFGNVEITSILCGFGPLLSGLICYAVFKTNNNYQINFKGKIPWLTLSVVGLAAFLPLIFFTKIPKHVVIVSMISQIVYSFGEEFGWRHFLLNATIPIHKWIRPFLCGTIWFAWHYSFIDNPIQAILGQQLPVVLGVALSILVLSLLHFLWADATIKSQSILIPTIAHAITKYGDLYSVIIIITILLLINLFWNKVFR